MAANGIRIRCDKSFITFFTGLSVLTTLKYLKWNRQAQQAFPSDNKMIWLIATAILGIYYLYVYFTTKCNYWVERNVSQKSQWAILRNFGSNLLRRQSFSDLIKVIYNEFPNKRYSGFYQIVSPVIILRDPKLIKKLMVKDFDYFMDHTVFLSEDYDPIWTQNLFFLKGEEWRKMRATLTPSFTSSKMKAMFVLISECAESFVKHFQNKDMDIVTVEMTDVLSRYSNDVIATTAFGVKCNSLENRENEFYMMGKKATDFSDIWRNLKLLIAIMSPKLANIFGIQMFDKSVGKFFHKLVKESIQLREEMNIVRPDMIHLLMEARKDKHLQENEKLDEAGFTTVQEHVKLTSKKNCIELIDTDITAQALVFFFAGFVNISRSLCFTTYELAVNKDIQDKLKEEIDETLSSCNGKITYEGLIKMKYLDMVISESLRKWPNAFFTDRICVKDYTIEPVNDDEKPVPLKVGDIFWIPIIAIHYDQQYYPEPERFDPERFNNENKSKINPYTYLPFGVGPRDCIASKFALLEMKIIIFHILGNFEIVPVEKTQIPLKISKKQFILTAENGFWLGLKRRNLS